MRHFLEVTHIEQGTAEVVTGILEKHTLPLKKMAGIATDDAAAISGRSRGVAATHAFSSPLHVIHYS